MKVSVDVSGSLQLEKNLRLQNCPHCNVDTPTLEWFGHEMSTTMSNGGGQKNWRSYYCKRCGGVVTGCRRPDSPLVLDYFPKSEVANESIPQKPKQFLNEAIRSKSSPSGAIMLCASSIDAMLKDKGYKTGTLYNRIDKAAQDHLITSSMAEWAHQVRLDANDQRHADEDAELPNMEAASRIIDFAKAFAEYLYVLPAKVAKGMGDIPPSNEGVVVSP